MYILASLGFRVMHCFILLFNAVALGSAPPDRSAGLWLCLTSRLVVHTRHCGGVVHTSISTILNRPLTFLTHRDIVPRLAITCRGPGRHALVVHHRVDVWDSSHSFVVAEAVLTHATIAVHALNQILFV